MTLTIKNFFRRLTFRKPLPGHHTVSFFMFKIAELERLALAARITTNPHDQRFLKTFFVYNYVKLKTMALKYAPGSLPAIPAAFAEEIKILTPKPPMAEKPGLVFWGASRAVPGRYVH